jgi:hypothetical protein
VVRSNVYPSGGDFATCAGPDVNAEREPDAHTECDAQFDSNSDADLYTQANSKRKTKGYAQTQANPGSSTLDVAFGRSTHRGFTFSRSLPMRGSLL